MTEEKIIMKAIVVTDKAAGAHRIDEDGGALARLPGRFCEHWSLHILTAVRGISRRALVWP
jgi:hypothetical protein